MKGTSTALQNYLWYTEWHVFRVAASQENRIDIHGYKISHSVGDQRQSSNFATMKAWMSEEVRVSHGRKSSLNLVPEQMWDVLFIFGAVKLSLTLHAEKGLQQQPENSK